ncbi:MAG: hypothetical protein ACJ744_09210 [Gaiellaceae bacterium]|jgi:hypothetical protein
MSENTPNRPSMGDRRVRAAVLIGFVVVVIAVVVFATRDNGNSSSSSPGSTSSSSPATESTTATGPRTTPPLPTVTTTPGQAAPRAMTLARLKTLAHTIKHPVYWAGPMKNAVYEVTYTPGGNFSVRYLPAGSKAGAKTFIATVSTFPFPGAYDSIKQLEVQGGMQKVDTDKGSAVAVTSQAYPQSIRLAFPGKDFQIEVISPSVPRVTKLVKLGSIRPIA